MNVGGFFDLTLRSTHFDEGGETFTPAILPCVPFGKHRSHIPVFAIYVNIMFQDSGESRKFKRAIEANLIHLLSHHVSDGFEGYKRMYVNLTRVLLEVLVNTFFRAE